MTIFEQLSKMIVDRMGVEPEQVTENASFKDDLGADSLDVVEFIMELEEAFDVEIPDEDAGKLLTVGDVVTYLDSKK